MDYIFKYKNLADYNRLMSKLVKSGLDGEAIGNLLLEIAATTEDQPNSTKGVSMLNEKIGNL